MGELLEVGDVDRGLDVRSAVRLTELVRLLGDCGNCVAKRFCSHCPAMVSQAAGSRRANAAAFQKQCQQIVDELPARLADYTTVMEMNRSLIDELLGHAKTEDWAADVKFVLTEEQVREIERSREAVEETL